MAATDAQRVPAWKRLGLKLKQPASEGPNDNAGSGAVGHPSSSSAAQSSPKRKMLDPPGGSRLNPIHGNKRPRRDVSPKPAAGTKKVTFGDTPSKKDVVGDSRKASEPSKQQQPKKKSAKGPTKKQQPATPPSIADIKPALEYLQLWKSSRESWKFNKNHQSSLIRFFFDDVFPSSHVDPFYDYIRELKGFIRTRLRETAMEIRTQDESDGYAAFPEGTTDVDEKQTAYNSVLAGILRRRQAGKRKFFDEPRYVAESEDGDVILRRLIKRMRAELVIEELSDSEESTGTVTTSTSSKTVTASDNNATVTTDEDKQVALNPSNNATSRRRRKLRTNMDDSSSSESESGSESEASSSSEDDSDSDEEERPDEEDTSSSSSSSSSEGESDSDEASDEE